MTYKYAVFFIFQGWIVASDSVTDHSYTVRSLRPDTDYMFLVRARNSHGLSLPSQVTAVIRTKGSSRLSVSLHKLTKITVYR